MKDFTNPPVADLTLSQPVEELRLADEVLTNQVLNDEIRTTVGDRTIAWERITGMLTAPEPGQLKYVLACGSAALAQLFRLGESAGQLVRDRARLVDLVVCSAWQLTTANTLSTVMTSLVAVGGYGRGELHPHSDVDVLILLNDADKHNAEEPLSGFLALLWDLGLKVGHSTRTIDECSRESERDITVVTTLMESRLLTGSQPLFAAMQTAVMPDRIWPARYFFEAKLREQQARHHRYGDTAYNLEPNIKGSPGGLRDIQMILWVTQRHFGSNNLSELVGHGFLTPGQLRLLQQGREFLWRLRFALHVLTRRGEDRLLFDYQMKIAHLFGYKDATFMLAVEQLMQRYYRTVMDLSRLNEMLLQRFQEEILMNPEVIPEQLTERFQTRNGFLQVANSDVFKQTPSALLELFLLLQQHPELKGVSASTITAIKRNLHLIDDEFRQDPHNHELFMQIISAPEGVTHELRRMNTYGVLGRYIPAFGRIIGRMQYDLFHSYTVDAHTLFVVSNLRRFALSRFDHEFPDCSAIMQSLLNPEIAYLAGLFHDIAKGRGGDHSKLGAVDAESFCLEHGMARYDAHLVAWLVRHHLTLSITAQKKDIGDPNVIHEFSATVGDEQHLDYLYLLTVADVRATNPTLWNSWKAQLLEGLYRLTKQALRRGLTNPIDKDELIAKRKQEAHILLTQAGLSDEKTDLVWSYFTDEYFLRCRPEEIDSHTRLFASQAGDQPTIMIDLMEQAYHGGTALFLFTPQPFYAFATSTAVLDELGLNIVDARIIPLHNQYQLTTFVIIEQSGERISDHARLKLIKSRLTHALTSSPSLPVTVTRRAPRQVRLFDTATLISFTQDDTNCRTIMEIVAGDRPGLLYEVSQILRNHEIGIQTAKVLTIGERAEDVFFITNRSGNPLSADACRKLEADLLSALSDKTM
ncbi:MAG TPA: [protein-PII] uridylyltransferase [Gammaproteobacteria bacterium]|jgi:[protein-PII] uridylyltransferase|nr:[protein-PII] uridylyltransferase [Chromatiales bacterium]MCP4925508.1 [protein-PII] uridylyltransferase [Gammaproteobacteria bacterium]MDP7296580.1 [protein-PII] uridylyltransferase [Gammaproteobacteria bacterium]MDP7660468.1 [protein-PII] uridylyltransferase [Gammaproteobacteria bacterium]HJP39739.1 [protein-PII] uridylyltransferase [Gammaproteobacteria bacterium]